MMPKASDAVTSRDCAPPTAVETTGRLLPLPVAMWCPEECAGAFTETVWSDVLSYVAANPGCSQRAVERALRCHHRADVRATLYLLLAQGSITRRGERGRAGSRLEVVR